MKKRAARRAERERERERERGREREGEREGERKRSKSSLSQSSPRSYFSLFPGSRSTEYASTISRNPFDASARSASEAPGGSLSGCAPSAAPRKAAETSCCDAAGLKPSVA
jgi:hypothetical protein